MSKTEFDNEQFLSAYPIGVENNYWTVARNLILKNKLNSFGLKSNKVLEIGCGRGIVVDYLRKSGFDCVGVELSEMERDLVSSEYVKFGTDFADLDSAVLDSIEVVMLLDVIEHLPNPDVFLKKIRETFKNLKYLLVTVPARMDIWSNYDTYYGHYVRYEINSLKKVVDGAGFESKSTSYFFHALYFPARILSFFNLDREVKISAPKSIWILIHKVLGIIFYIESKILPGMLLGSSLISVSKTQNVK